MLGVLDTDRATLINSTDVIPLLMDDCPWRINSWNYAHGVLPSGLSKVHWGHLHIAGLALTQVMERQGDASHVHGLESHTTQGDAGGDAGGDSSQWVCDPFLSRFSSLSEYLDIVT